MSFINDKSGLVSEIAVSKAIEENFPELNKGKVSFDSIKSSQGNLIPFFLDLLVMLVDSGEVKTEFTKFIAKTDVWEKEMKESLVQTIVETYSNNVNFSGITDQFPIDVDIRNVEIGARSAVVSGLSHRPVLKNLEKYAEDFSKHEELAKAYAMHQLQWLKAASADKSQEYHYGKAVVAYNQLA